MTGNCQPSALREKRCPACGALFACFAGECWCDAVRLTPETQARLRERYADCLCDTCLRQHQQLARTASKTSDQF
jgi:hypothetical protein